MNGIEAGEPVAMGATAMADGVQFVVHSSVAERIELCLYDGEGNESGKHDLPASTGDAWHGFLPGCKPGQAYGYRVHGPYDPAAGLRCNPAKLLIDPYARELRGAFRWHDAVHDYIVDKDAGDRKISHADSAPYLPLGVVSGNRPAASAGPRIPWTETVIYETNVRGYTMRHPDIPDNERGRFRGMANGAIVAYLRALGISSIELLPVHSFIDEMFLVHKGLRNYWGYNSLNFFAPANRYAQHDAVQEFRDMVNALHDAGIEVILDVVYNHTAEGGESGPTLSFRGFDNAAYYRLHPDNPGICINDTGCGNTVNADAPVVQQLVLDSLRYWSGEMGVDGFRFDLAPVIGRSLQGFSPSHPLLQAIGNDPGLQDCKLIAEPWDIGPGGYQAGQFPARWSEWNDAYRDATRQWWLGYPGSAAAFAAGLQGSSALFETGGRTPAASINFLTSHDGYTLQDLVSYEKRHNLANGERNRDGHRHNFSSNHGIEGPSEDDHITTLRRQQRLNLLYSLLLSQGTPMLLAGDEFGNSQHGNNNVYAQDNECGWIDWQGLADDPGFQRQVGDVVRLRRHLAVLQQDEFLHAQSELRPGWPDILWLQPGGDTLNDGDWDGCTAFTVVFGLPGPGNDIRALALLMNSAGHENVFSLQHYVADNPWQVLASSTAYETEAENCWRLPAHSMVALQTGES